jgi:1-phosphofructokinase
MIVTVTANTSIDHVVFIPRYELNKTVRATRVLQSIGGKPTDTSWILGELGIKSRALGFYAGMTGEQCKGFLQAQGAETDFISVEGESRRNLIIVNEDGSGQTSITASTLIVHPEHVEALYTKLVAALEQATVVVMGGTLPHTLEPSLYTRFVRTIREAGVPLVFDASEPFLSAGLQSGPDFIKPNDFELGELVGRPIKTPADAYEAGREVIERFGAQPIISLGPDGGMAVLHDRAYRIPVVPVEVVSTSGAGDGILAGITAALYRGDPIEDGLRLGFGAAAAICTMPGTAECRRDDVLRYAEQVELIPYP